MAYSTTVSFPDDTGRGSQGVVFTPPNFEQIFDGFPQYYAGSTIQILEQVQFFTSVYDPSLVDVDFNYFQRKKYLGSYQIGDTNTSLENIPGNVGFINYEIQKIRRYANYTITANPAVPIGVGEVSSISNCNFSLRELTIGFGGLVVGDFLPGQAENIFISQDSLSRVPLEDKQFNGGLNRVGLFLLPGAQIDNIEYSVTVINGIEVRIDPYPSITCNPPSFDPCQALYVQWLTDNAFYRTAALAAANGTGGPIVSFTFVCPADSTKTFLGYAEDLIMN